MIRGIPALVLGLAAAVASAQSPKTPDTYGSGHISLYRVGFSEFVPADSGLTYSDRIVVTNGYARYPTTTSFFAFVAVPHLPAGALVSSVEFDWCDKNATDDANFYVESTSYTGENDTVLSMTSSFGSAGCEYSVAELSTPYTVDNNLSQLVLSAFIPDTDGSLAIAGAIVKYTLQVSPAPATATFNDVPTSHPFFQYIEALAASGITGGCQTSPPKYCPDAPVTRGQMAVFLAKALGLQFE
jgi:S-layer homology domain